MTEERSGGRRRSGRRQRRPGDERERGEVFFGSSFFKDVKLVCLSDALMIVFRCLGSGWRLELRSARERGRCRKRDERGKQNKKTWSLGQKSPHSFQIRHLDQVKKLRRRLSTQKGCKLSSLPRWLLGPSEKKRVTAPMLSPREKRSPGAPARTRRATKAVSSRRQLRGLPLRAATSTNRTTWSSSRALLSLSCSRSSSTSSTST